MKLVKKRIHIESLLQNQIYIILSWIESVKQIIGLGLVKL